MLHSCVPVGCLEEIRNGPVSGIMVSSGSLFAANVSKFFFIFIVFSIFVRIAFWFLSVVFLFSQYFVIVGRPGPQITRWFLESRTELETIVFTAQKKSTSYHFWTSKNQNERIECVPIWDSNPKVRQKYESLIPITAPVFQPLLSRGFRAPLFFNHCVHLSLMKVWAEARIACLAKPSRFFFFLFFCENLEEYYITKVEPLQW